MEQTATAAKEAGAGVVQDATDKAKGSRRSRQRQIQELIDAAKLVGEGKLQDALAKLKEIGGQALSPDQKATVDALKSQIELALKAGPKTAADAARAVGRLLRRSNRAFAPPLKGTYYGHA
ncbi:MAG: hypothetical protein KIT22_01610 [Verrucomicrobiae bacterium]|nr:hypothetical protein [Verrucomicrobiae bacterium]